MFELDRIFSQYSAKTGLTEWYFNAREGVCGPYATKQRAEEELEAFIQRQKKAKDDGGRAKGKTKLTLVPLEFSLQPIDMSHSKKNKNLSEL